MGHFGTMCTLTSSFCAAQYGPSIRLIRILIFLTRHIKIELQYLLGCITVDGGVCAFHQLGTQAYRDCTASKSKLDERSQKLASIASYSTMCQFQFVQGQSIVFQTTCAMEALISNRTHFRVSRPRIYDNSRLPLHLKL